MAVFSEQGTSASHMAAAKFMDAVARMPDCDGEDSDAIGAYTQVALSDAQALIGTSKEEYIETWISLPKERQPAGWSSIDRPVCILRLNLYGHPLAGLIWERHCQKAIFGEGFVKVPGWECLYENKKEQLYLSVYVDDFKMAGNAKNLKTMWQRLSKSLDLEPPVPLDGNVYLGCGQREIHPPKDFIDDKRRLFGKLVYDRKDKTESNPERLEHGGDSQQITDLVPKPKAKRQKKGSMAATPCHPKTIKAYHYDMSGHAEQCVDRYLELAKVTKDVLKPVPTPCIDDHMFSPEEFESRGKLTEVAARIVLKCLYTARMGRPDTLWAVNTLAREVTRWNVACDKRLLRLIS